MNKQLRDDWVKALRSGEYRQGQARLQRGDEFCCLGVLCAVAEKTSFCGVSRYEGGDLCGATLMFQSDKLRRQIEGDASFDGTVMSLNDTGKDFSHIADWIEQHIPTE